MTSFKAKGNPIKKYTEQNRQLDCCDWHSFLSDSTTKIKYDLGVVVSFGHLIPAYIINLFPLYVIQQMTRQYTLLPLLFCICRGIINVHASLLPRWRGASPIIHAILNDDRLTGVSIMKIHPDKFDVGEILAQREVPIPSAVLMPELHEALATVGAQLLVECIENAPASFHNAKQQDDTNVTYGMCSHLYQIVLIKERTQIIHFELFSSLAPKVTDEMTHIDWHKHTSQYICNLYRAVYSFKWLTTDWHRRRVKIKEIDLKMHESGECGSSVVMSPGRVEYDKLNKCLRVYCCDGSFIRVTKLGLEGKKSEMSASDFNNGFLKKVDRAQRYFTS